jgi:hypothetical protein
VILHQQVAGTGIVFFGCPYRVETGSLNVLESALALR